MKISIKSALITIILAAAAGAVGVWLGGQLLAKGPAAGNSLHAMVHEELSLSADQENQLHDIERSFADRRQALEGEMRKANAELAVAIRASGNVSSITDSGVGLYDVKVNVNGGAVNTEALKISGSGTINLLNLSAKYVSAETSGSGKTTVRVSDNLDVRISGSGDVYYAGNPSVHTVISGSGRVSRL